MEYTITHTDGRKTLPIIEDNTDSVYSPNEVEIIYSGGDFDKLIEMVGLAVNNGITIELPFSFTPIEGLRFITSYMRIYSDGKMEFVISTEYGNLVTEEMTI